MNPPPPYLHHVKNVVKEVIFLSLDNRDFKLSLEMLIVVQRQFFTALYWC